MKPKDTSIFDSSLTLEENIIKLENSFHEQDRDIITEIENLTNTLNELNEKKNEITSKLNDPISLVFDYFDSLSEALKQREKDVKSLGLVQKDYKAGFFKKLFSFKKSIPKEENVKERLKKKINVNCYTLTKKAGKEIDFYLYTPIKPLDIKEKNILGRLYLSFLGIAGLLGGAGLGEEYIAFKFKRPASGLDDLVSSIKEYIGEQWPEIKEIYNLDITLSGKTISEKVVSEIIKVSEKIPGKRGRKKSELRIKYEKFLETGLLDGEKGCVAEDVMKKYNLTHWEFSGLVRKKGIKPLLKIGQDKIYLAKLFDDYFEGIEKEPSEIISKPIKEKKEIEQYIPKGQINLFEIFKFVIEEPNWKILFDKIFRTGMYNGNRVYLTNELMNMLDLQNTRKLPSKLKGSGVKKIKQITFMYDKEFRATSVYPADEFDKYIELLRFKNQLNLFESIEEKVITKPEEKKKLSDITLREEKSSDIYEEDIKRIEKYKKYLTGEKDVDDIIINGFPVQKDVRKPVYILEQIIDLIPEQFRDEFSENDVIKKWIKLNEIYPSKAHDTLFYDSKKIDEAIIITDFERFIKGCDEWKKPGNIKLIKLKRTPKEWEEVLKKKQEY